MQLDGWQRLKKHCACCRLIIRLKRPNSPANSTIRIGNARKLKSKSFNRRKRSSRKALIRRAMPELSWVRAVGIPEFSGSWRREYRKNIIGRRLLSDLMKAVREKEADRA